MIDVDRAQFADGGIDRLHATLPRMSKVEGFAAARPCYRIFRLSRFTIRLPVLGLTVCSAGFSQEAPSGSSRVRIIATHDLHGVLHASVRPRSDGRPVGGIAALKATVNALRAECACPVVWVDGGDQMHGTLESNLAQGEAVVAPFNHMGLDAAAIGNHEFDWGVDTLVTRQSEADYPWLAANIFRADNGERPEWAQPFTIVERDGVRVGVIGYTWAGTPRTQLPAVTGPYEFRGGYSAIRDVLDEVWSQQPDFVVIAAHAAGDCRANPCAGEMVDLAAQIPPGRVHLIAGGHAHAPGQGVVNSIPIIRAGSSGSAVASVDLYRLEDGSRSFEVSVETVYADTVEGDPDVANLLAPYLAAADAVGQVPVTTLAEPISPFAGPSDRRLGHLVADASRLQAGADVGMQHPQVLRYRLPGGTVTYADVYRVIPSDDMVVKVTITGSQIRQLIELVGPRYYFSNLLVEFDPASASGSKVVSLKHGTPIGDEQAYTMATNDLLAEGGAGLAMLAPLPREALDVKVRDAFIQRLRELPTPVSLPIEERTTVLQAQ